MKGSYKVTRVQFMDLQRGPDGRMMPTLWDSDDRRDGKPRLKVAVECSCDPDGNLMDVSISSDDSHVQFAEESQGDDALVD